MAATVQRREAGIEIQTGQLRVFVHLATLRMQVTSADGRVGLRGFRPRFWVHDRPVVASEAVADIIDDVQTPLGPATRISLICRSVKMSWRPSGCTIVFRLFVMNVRKVSRSSF